jgi:23S rRNA (cytidine2498-2'-O)-methyltransferase
MLNNVIIYCRPGFEKEASAEIADLASAIGVYGYPKAQEGSAWICYVTHDDNGALKLIQQLDFSTLIFARQWFAAGPLLENLPEKDRIGPLMSAVAEHASVIKPSKLAAEFSVEYPDTNEGKTLSPFCRKITVPFRQTIKHSGLLKATGKYRLHLMFLSGREAWVGVSKIDNSSRWAMGIPRLKVPKGAPSRATLKLEEAWHCFIPEEEWPTRLPAGKRAVDLGAAPGGWTWQLVEHGMYVDAVDNGPMAPELMATGMVDHIQGDAFTYEPRKPVYWVVSDIADKPAKVADLMARWVAKGLCREAVFNLKLPMKKRYQEVLNCKDKIASRLSASDIRYELRFRQLYHDREEVTGHIRRLID